MSSYRILATLLVISTAALGVHAQEQKPIAGGQAASGQKSGAQAQQGGIKMEIVREDDEYVWLRGISPEDPNSPLYKVWAQREAEEARAADWAEFSKQPGAVNFMDFGAVMVPPPEIESLTFVSGGGTLPNKGRWQMGFAVADMNEDGHQDLVFPPQRKQLPPAPSILLGDGTGNFSYWNESKWPEAMPWDYGDVVAGDFNNDGHQDVVFAVHFKSQFALFGNGDDVTSNARFEGSPSAWVLFNRGDDWEISSEGLPQNLIADVIRSADLDGDGRPELIISSNTLGPRMLVYSWRDAEGWVAAEHRGLLSASYHYDVEPTVGGVFSTFVQFGRFQSATQARNGLIHYPTSFDGEFETPVPLVWDKERGNVFFRLAVGDLDGDGHPDLVAGRKNGGLEVYLQSEDGSFYRERGTELDSVGRAFDIRLVDLDGDGRDDIIAGCVEQDERPGGIYVWLSRPSV
ncbi:MAG: VCBS repeat-containing protein [Acidobacteriota bacterium]